MDRNSIYYKQVQLLIQVLPFVAKQQCFALKGGTAINLFVRDFPRLSVDIDLVYLPMKSRDDALQEICDALDAISSDLKIAFKDIELTEAYRSKRDALRLIVALADLYAGKICAALDRQHPRDLFDVKWLLENEGLTDEIRKALLVYLSSHNRPMAELLSPQFKDITATYEGEFTNMAETDVPLVELEAVRMHLVDLIHQGLTDSEKSFLLSFKNREPDWSLIGLDGVSELPAIKWKQINLANMPNDKHTQALAKLKDVLGV